MADEDMKEWIDKEIEENKEVYEALAKAETSQWEMVHQAIEATDGTYHAIQDNCPPSYNDVRLHSILTDLLKTDHISSRSVNGKLVYETIKEYERDDVGARGIDTPFEDGE